MQKRFIPVSAPMLIGNEKKYVNDCIDSTWISSNGKYIDEFEDAFAKFCGAKYSISCCNGTVALHLALRGLGVGPGDEVLVPTLTFVATANAVTYCGARPVFLDSDGDTWNLDPALIEKKITPRTKGIVVVHLYGNPVDMNVIGEIAKRHGIFVLEDAAEAHGAEYNGKKAGTIGQVGIFSFYGNKIVTCGEGGMVITDDPKLAAHIRQMKGQGMDVNHRYWFPIIGYNYRMTNIAAAIGLGQLEKISWHLQRRLEIAAHYKAALRKIPGIVLQKETPNSKHSHWIFSIVLSDTITINRDDVMQQLLQNGIETRPIFYPMHILPPYADQKVSLPVAERLAARGFSLPTWGGLTGNDLDFICEKLDECLKMGAK